MIKIPVKIISAPIIREANGLAMSSRNQYLSEVEKEQASNIYKILCKIQEGLSIENAKAELEQHQIETEYLEEKWERILFAGRIGKTRLIDND